MKLRTITHPASLIGFFFLFGLGSGFGKFIYAFLTLFGFLIIPASLLALVAASLYFMNRWNV